MATALAAPAVATAQRVPAKPPADTAPVGTDAANPPANPPANRPADPPADPPAPAEPENSAPQDLPTDDADAPTAGAAPLDMAMPEVSASAAEAWVNQPVDADAPLPPMPDIEVPWPDFDVALPPMAPLPPSADLPPDEVADGGAGDAAGATASAGSAMPVSATVTVDAAVDAAADAVVDADLPALPPPIPGAGDAPVVVADPLPALPPPVTSSLDTAATGDPVLDDMLRPFEAAAEQVVVNTNADGAAVAELNDTGRYRYRVSLAPMGDVADAAFAGRFAGLSQLIAADDDDANAAQINRRIVADTELLNQMLRNAGYYDATVASSIVQSGERIEVRFGAVIGPIYRYEDVRVSGLTGLAEGEAERLRSVYGVFAEQAIIAERLIGAQVALETELRETGYPFGDVLQEIVKIDHDTRLGVLDQPVAPGRRLRFGQIIVNDGGLLGAEHLGRIARFDPGEWYRQSDVTDLSRALMATGIVGSVSITPVDAPAAGDATAGADTVDLAVELTPAPLRTLAGSLGFSSGEGVRLEASWEHRNLFPPEGALILRGVLGTDEQLGSMTFRRSNFRARDRILSLQALVSQVDRAGFDARTVQLSGRLERQSTLIFQKRWIWSFGAEILATDERSFDPLLNATVRRTYFVGAVPLFVGYDRSDSLLDPTSGYRLSARFSPEGSLESGFSGYARVQVDGSIYRRFNERIVLAARVRAGSLLGTDAPNVAPSRRYYAGGGSSVRGYGYQAIGARDINNDPIGGQSVIEMSAEARVRLGVFSVVPFLDAGNVYDSQLPRLSGLRFGAGVGVRYHSSFGPIRVDVGTPLNPRPGDSRIAVYVSLGQAF